jgi:hypothetical protein
MEGEVEREVIWAWGGYGVAWHRFVAGQKG